MRKINVFGKKVGQFHLLYIIVVLFVIIFATRWWIIGKQEALLIELQDQQLLLDRQLNVLIESENRETIHMLADIEIYLPTALQEKDINDDMSYLKDVCVFTEPGSYEYQVTFNVNNPLSYTFPTTMKFVQIRLSIITLDRTQIENLVTNLYELHQIYYIDSVEISVNETEIQTNFVIYAFYNEIL